MSTGVSPVETGPSPFADGPIPLENGDRVTRDEFDRRAEVSPHGKRAELIRGVVYMPATVRFRQHGQPQGRLLVWLAQYELSTTGVEAFAETTLDVDENNQPQPDAVLRIMEPHGGGTYTTEAGYLAGVPEFVAEVAASSSSIDMHAKLDVYRQHRIPEYLVWRVLDSAIDWFVLRGDEYRPLLADDCGILKSEKFPGLWLDRAAMIEDRRRDVRAVLKEGLASEDHRRFVEALAVRSKD